MNDHPALPPSLDVAYHATGETRSIAVLRLCRPQKRNALDDATIAGIDQFFATLPTDTAAVVIHGEGAHFCAGLDLNTITDSDATEGLYRSRAWHRAFDRIAGADVPVIAALQGAVIGGGLELALACHIRVADHTVFYALPEGQRGIFVGGGAAVRLPRLIGIARMQDMMLTGRVYGGEEGGVVGFSQYVTEAGQALQKAMEVAASAAQTAKLTTFAVLHALPRIAEADPNIGGLMESLMAALAAGDGEARVRVRAFLEGRAAKLAPNA